MEIIFLGSGTGFPRKERASPGILVKLPYLNILMDSGPGSMRQLAKLGLSTNDIDIIMYTHLHPDHTLDLMDFLFCAKYQVVAKKNLPQAVRRFIAQGRGGFRTKPLHIIGPVGFKDFYAKVKNLYGLWITVPTYKLTIIEVRNQKLEIRNQKLESAEMLHESRIGGSVGYRIEHSGKSVVYSGDTAYCDNIVRLGKNADLLILECSTSDEINLPMHLTPRTVAKIACESNAKKVILTHIYEVGDKFNLLKQVKRTWKEMPQGKIKLAYDLMRLRI